MALPLWAATTDAAPITLISDDLGRLIAVIDATGDTSRFEYDAVGNLLSISRHSSATVTIIRFSPAAGPAGTTLTIQGTGFGATPAENTVSVNGIAATVSAASATELTVTVPAGVPPGPAPIAATAPGGSASSATPFTVTATSEAPTITAFTPALADRGASVTIEGTQFELTPLNNKVTFNARPGYATVTAATSTALSATVPTNATSGRVTLATPGGQTTSSADFFVPPTGATAAQTVFTGRLTLGGSSLTFTIPVNKVGLVVFDGTAGQFVDLGYTGLTAWTTVTVYRPDGAQLAYTGSGPTGSGLGMVLPVTGTYTILGTTPYGSNLTLTLSEEIQTSIAVGGPAVPVALTRLGQRARVSFTGTAGQRLSLGLTGTGVGGGAVTVLNPDGTTLSSAAPGFPGALDLPVLPTTGTYTIIVDVVPYTGTVTLTLSEEVTGTITIGGPSIPVTIARGGQRARLTFSATAGQRLSLGLTNVTITYGTALIAKPDGTSLASGGFAAGGGTAVDTPALPVTGTYTILIDPSAVYTGDVTLTLSEELAGTLALDGGPVTVTITRPGQRARETFAGTAGLRASINLTGNTISQPTVAILDPNGTQLNPPSWIGASFFIEPVNLAVTGTYAILIDPSGAATGQITLTPYSVPPDVTGSLTINGDAVPVTVSAPGQNASLTFSGTSGQSITIAGSGSTLGCTFVSLTRPGGATSSLGQPCTATFSFAQSLTATGTYTLKLDPATTNTGSVNVTVTSP